jgi:hypothetical protein
VPSATKESSDKLRSGLRYVNVDFHLVTHVQDVIYLVRAVNVWLQTFGTGREDGTARAIHVCESTLFPATNQGVSTVDLAGDRQALSNSCRSELLCLTDQTLWMPQLESCAPSTLRAADLTNFSLDCDMCARTACTSLL